MTNMAGSFEVNESALIIEEPISVTTRFQCKKWMWLLCLFVLLSGICVAVGLLLSNPESPIKEHNVMSGYIQDINEDIDKRGT